MNSYIYNYDVLYVYIYIYIYVNMIIHHMCHVLLVEKLLANSQNIEDFIHVYIYIYTCVIQFSFSYV